MVKRTLAILMAIVMLGMMMPLAIAQGTPTISVSSATAQPGETVELKVSISNNPGINAFELGFVFDSDRLELKNVQKGSASALKDSMVEYTEKPWMHENEDMRTVWFYGRDQDLTYNGVYLILTFHVLSTAPEGEAGVEIVLLESEFTNVNEDDIEFSAVPGSIQIVQDQATVSLSKETGRAGGNVLVNVILKNNPGIAGLALSIKYDSNIFNLKEANSTGLFSGFTLGKNLTFDDSQNISIDGTIATLLLLVIILLR